TRFSRDWSSDVCSSDLAAAGTVLFVGIGWILGVDERRVAAAAEARRGLPAGSLRGVLELAHGLPSGASGALFRRAESEVESRLADRKSVVEGRSVDRGR